MSDDREAQRAAAHERRLYPAPLNAGRSRNMQANKRAGTKPEVRLRSALHALGYRFRKDLRLDLGTTKVRPDIVFTRRKVAVFVDGCFWHACPDHGRSPGRNGWYWEPKLARNVERDRQADAALSGAGWTVVRLWEHVPLSVAVAEVEHAVRTHVRTIPREHRLIATPRRNVRQGSAANGKRAAASGA